MIVALAGEDDIVACGRCEEGEIMGLVSGRYMGGVTGGDGKAVTELG